MNPFFRCRYWLTQVILVVIGAIAIACLIAAAPIVAQDNLNRVTIFLDGRPLFEVAPAGSLNAQQRANYASDTLKQIIETAPPTIDVEIAGTDNLPVIKVNGSYLLSVTTNDALTGRSPKEQARFWQILLQNAMKRAFIERTQDYIVQAVFLSVGCGLWGIISSWGVGWMWDHRIKWLFHKNVTKSTHRHRRQPAFSAEIAGGTVILLFRITILVFTLIYAINLFPQTRQLSRQVKDTFVQSLTWKNIWVGDKPYSVLGLLTLIGLFAALILLAKVVKKVLRSRILGLTNLSRPAQQTIAVIFHYGILSIGSIVLLQLWGIDFSSLAVFFGVLGVGIGFGIQGIAKECVSGLVLIFERPIQVGDFVNVGELMGTVENIGIRSTEILTLDQVSIIIPNSRFLEAEVVNWTHNNPVSRLKLPVGVAYGSDPIKVRSALIEAASQHQEILDQPTPNVFFIGFGENALNFELLVWIEDPPKQFQIKSELYFLIEEILRHYHVDIPFPKLDLHVRSDNFPVDASHQLIESLTQLSQELTHWMAKQSDASSHNGTSHNGTSHNGTSHNGTNHNGTNHNGTNHNNVQINNTSDNN